MVTVKIQFGFYLGTIVLALFASLFARSTSAQEILNVPPTPAPTSVGANVILNLSDGGQLGNKFTARAGSIVNVTGGLLGSFDATADSVVNLFDGSLIEASPYRTEEIYVRRGATVTVAGGAFVPAILAGSGSSLILEGFDFRLDGQPLPDLDQVGDMLQLDVAYNQLLTGVLADGTPFVNHHDTNSGVITLKRSKELATGPTTIEVPSDDAPSGIRDGQTLLLSKGGSLVANFTAVHGSTLRIAGGNVPGPVWAIDSEVQIESGSVGPVMARNGTIVTQTGGEMLAPSITEHSTFQLHGGVVAGPAYIDGHSEAHISGGVLTHVLIDRDGVLNIRGGAFGDGLSPNPGGLVNIDGYDFRINGQPVAGLEQVGNSVVIPQLVDAVVTGTLSDGTPFAFHWLDGDRVATGTWTVRRSLPPPSIPTIINVPSDPVPLGVGEGQTLDLGVNGDIGDHFNAGHGSTVHVNGGAIGNNFEVAGTSVNVHGGAIGDDMDVFHNSTVILNDGSIGERLSIVGGDIQVNGGVIGRDFKALHGSTVTVAGGEVRPSVISDSTLRVDGGLVIGGHEVINGSTVHVSGGELGYFRTLSDSTLFVDGGLLHRVNTRNSQIDIAGGVVGIDTYSDSPSSVTLRGGTAGRLFRMFNNSTLEVHGSNFEIDGQTVDLQVVGKSKNIQIPQGSLFSGILTDGTPFAIHSDDGDILAEEVRLVHTEIASVGQSVINVPSDSVPYGIRAGQTLNLSNGGEIGPSFQAGPGSSVYVTGGIVGRDFEAFGADVTISGGSFGHYFGVFRNSTARFEGGDVSSLTAYRDAEVFIENGVIGSLVTREGSTVEISGGNVDRLDSGLFVSNAGLILGGAVRVTGGNIAEINAGGEMIIAGGAIGDSFYSYAAASTSFRGFDFRIDGELVEGLESTGDSILFDPPAGSLFTGAFADGTPFLFSSLENDRFTAGTLTLERVDAVENSTVIVDIPGSPTPLGTRGGQTVNVNTDGQLADNFTATRDSIVNVRGGTVGSNFEAIGSEVNVHNGEVSHGLDLFEGSILNLFGGTIDRSEVYDGAAMNIEGGTVNSTLTVHAGGMVNVRDGILSGIKAKQGSIVDIEGGEILGTLEASSGSTIYIRGGNIGSGPRSYPQTRKAVSVSAENLEIRGGSFGDLFTAWTNSTAVHGRDFRINGKAVEGLQEIGATAVIDFPNEWVLSGVLEDGSPFLFTQAEGDVFQSDSFGSLILVHTPDDILPPPIIEIPSDHAPNGVSDGQRLTLHTGGSLPNNFVALHGTQIRILDGIVGTNFEAMGAWVEINGGTVGDGFDAFDKTRVIVNGGMIGDEFTAHAGSALELAGGHFGSVRLVDAEAELRGATVTEMLASGGHLTISGGTIEGEFSATFSEVTILGSHFLLNGEPIPGLTDAGDSIELEPSTFSSLLTGVLQDGTPLHAEIQLGSYAPPRLVDGLSTTSGNSSTSAFLHETAFHTFIGKSVIFRIMVVPEPTTLVLVTCFCLVYGVLRFRVGREF